VSLRVPNQAERLNAMSIQVLIVDDHEVVRSGLDTLLSDQEIEVVGAVGEVNAAIDFIRATPPDVILLDVRMGEQDGLDALAAIRQLRPQQPVVMLSTYDNPTYVARSVALGANDYVLKSDPRPAMMDAIRRAARGEGPSPTSVLSRVQSTMKLPVEQMPTVDLPLTSREIQVLRHLALGLSNREIGHSLEISVETVKEHVQNILRKLNVADRTEAAVRAIKAGVVS
jgi:DNA-binding NarL/FixJ family response regulator